MATFIVGIGILLFFWGSFWYLHIHYKYICIYTYITCTILTYIYIYVLNIYGWFKIRRGPQNHIMRLPFWLIWGGSLTELGTVRRLCLCHVNLPSRCMLLNVYFWFCVQNLVQMGRQHHTTAISAIYIAILTWHGSHIQKHMDCKSRCHGDKKWQKHVYWMNRRPDDTSQPNASHSPRYLVFMEGFLCRALQLIFTALLLGHP